MLTDRQVQETVARCVSTMVFYHNSERSRKADEQMTVEVWCVAGFLEEMGLAAADFDERISRPVEGELIARYGHELGPRLFGKFIGAFESSKVVDGRCPGFGAPKGRVLDRW